MDLKKCVDLIDYFLNNAGILLSLKNDSSAYVGGSLPSFILSQVISGKTDDCPCNDIDVYTTNYVKTVRNISKICNGHINKVVKTGVNISFELGNNIPVQVITSEFESFYDDILENYDSDLVSVGYFPYKSEFYVHKRFMNALQNKCFSVMYEKSNQKRIDKLTQRASDWFGSQMIIIKETADADFRPYFRGKKDVNYIQEIVKPPKYLQLYYDIYDCVSCGRKQQFLLCHTCRFTISSNIQKYNQIKGKNIIVLGGVNGFGKIVAEVSQLFGNNTKITSRKPDSAIKNAYEFNLTEGFTEELLDHVMNADILILNAYSTLDSNEKIWLHTIDTFDEQLALDKFALNTLGYVKFMKQFISKRRELINTQKTKDMTLIFVDANESRLDNKKMMDGKHLELNLAKTATKQIFYTNANLLASLSVYTICYDPGWLSYHAIPVEQKKSKSQYLISPDISAKALFYKIGTVDFENNIDNKKFIEDCSVYDVIDELSNN